ncbi:MAG: hypothetical protein HGA44_22955, partial [Cellulomonadaceae bacterium]|nr:hypothetical protein [Cellulomonadaceae bacterium]
ETRRLVRNGTSCWVLDLATGATTRVPTWPIGTQHADRRSEARPLAWLGGDGLLVSQSYGKRVELAYQPLDGTARYPVLDLPVAGRAGDALGVVLAADVVHRSPWLVGKREATPDD